MMDALSDSLVPVDAANDSDNESVRSICQFTNGRIKRKPKARSKWKLAQA